MKRTVIKIDENTCNGCGACVSGCHEGALQLIGGKAVMVSDLYCDGLGACIGECPVGAITLEERESEPYDEKAVMERLIPKGKQVVLAHLNHLNTHGETEWLREGLDYLKERGIDIGFDMEDKNGACADGEKQPDVPKTGELENPLACGCPGSVAREIKRDPAPGFTLAYGTLPGTNAAPQSELRQFPVQLHLLNPSAGFLKGADLLLAADCTAFASGDFHARFLRGKVLAIACPKLDSNIQSYVDKLVAMIDTAKIDTLTVVVMEVPCCQGLVKIALTAREQSERHIPIKVIVLSVGGDVVKEEWVQ